jgi:N-acetylglutamate synthase-like GNAT family acetyltransferase
MVTTNEVQLMLRAAVQKDIPRLVELINVAYRVEDFFINGDRTHAAQVQELMQQGTFLMAERSGQIVATVYVEISARRGYFGPLAVDPHLQKSGLGKQLIAACETFCRERGCYFLDLSVASPRQELPSFYARFGFYPYDIRPFPFPEKLRREAHLIYLTKPLVDLHTLRLA